MSECVHCGVQSGPAVLDVMLILGRDATVDRLQRALATLSDSTVGHTSLT